MSMRFSCLVRFILYTAMIHLDIKEINSHFEEHLTTKPVLPKLKMSTSLSARRFFAELFNLRAELQVDRSAVEL